MCVVVLDIPGEFLYADMSEYNVHMLLKGKIAEIFTKLDLTIYRKYIWYNKHGNQ